ncbi:acyltransferase family protein [Chryseobacterium daeguense]|uniref:acyltransferase family protein n=1 Tax=Chryseobacterium daeguense TaxID=412438 RepID=UPI00041848FD|nr:acyltransferase [Chryseobacterium daeguense]
MKENYIKSLTGLRTIAASMVFFHHFNPFGKETILYGIVNEFHIGVTIFFVLSGFLIGYRYGDKEVNVKQYFINRFARIYPIFFIFTLLTFLVFPPSGLKEIALNFTLLKGFSDEYKFTGIPQGWTLTVEECFYAFALVLIFLVKNKKILLIELIPFVLLGVSLLIFKDGDFIRNYTFLGRSFEFIAGFLLSYYIKMINYKTVYLTYFGTFFIVISCVLLYVVKGDKEVGVLTLEGQIINNYFLPLFGIVPLIYGLIKEETFISRILSTGLFEKLGKSSYVFYIIHMGVVQDLITKKVHSFVLLYVIMLIISWLIFHYIEEPLNALIKKIARPRRAKLM